MILYPPHDSIACYIHNLPIYYYGIIMAFSIFTGIILSSYFYKKYVSEATYSKFSDIIAPVAITSIIGARLFYILGNWNYYSNHINEILLINHGGISIYGAIIFGIISIALLSKHNNLPVLPCFDTVALVMPLCQSIGRWGNFINQEAYGKPYDGFLKMYIDIAHRYPQYSDVEFYHPTFLYESILNLTLFIALMCVFFKYKNIKTGTIFISYLLLYSIIRFIVESYRIDSVCYIFNMPVASFISLIIAATIIIYLSMRKLRSIFH